MQRKTTFSVPKRGNLHIAFYGQEQRRRDFTQTDNVHVFNVLSLWFRCYHIYMLLQRNTPATK